MTSRFCKLVINNVASLMKVLSVRHKSHRRLGLPPQKARSLQQRLKDINIENPKIDFKVDIGLPRIIVSRSSTDHSKKLSQYSKLRNDSSLEKLARDVKLEVPIKEVEEVWNYESAPYHIKQTAEYYGIFQDLFGDAYFYPQIILDIAYLSEHFEIPVCRGNVIRPSQAKSKPSVQFNADPNSLWTLLLTCPDSHITVPNAEYVHWFVGNIPNGDIKKGDTIVDYLQPFPFRGSGYHRFIFVLYKQDDRIDFSNFKKEGPCLQLKDRTFRTHDFYRDHQDKITPAGLSFFQSCWDSTLTDFFHQTLKMEELTFEYDFPKFYHPDQKWFPIRKAFNLYMDRYRDPKKIAREFLLKKLKQRHPFEKQRPPLEFPNAVPFTTEKGVRPPSWLKLELRKERNRFGRINDF
uniref:Large ribosomal subunit protein mL38 n=2 Tax=Clastoptera arizonana TaxID=38151 RepID=A0A1B6DR97_9HEMI